MSRDDAGFDISLVKECRPSFFINFKKLCLTTPYCSQHTHTHYSASSHQVDTKCSAKGLEGSTKCSVTFQSARISLPGCRRGRQESGTEDSRIPALTSSPHPPTPNPSWRGRCRIAQRCEHQKQRSFFSADKRRNTQGFKELFIQVQGNC